MGQTPSKQKISKASNSSSTADPSNQFPTSSTLSPDEGTVASSERPKRSRRSTLRRSIIGLVGKSKDASGPIHGADARSDAPPSSRKGWRRISRALSLGATEDGHTALTSVRPNKRKGKERAVEVVEGEEDEQPKPSTSSQRPVSPDPTRRQSSTSILTNPAGTENVLPEPFTDNDVDGSPPPLEPIDPPPPATLAPTRADPPQDPAPPIHPPLDQSQPGHRHFPPPGTLVVVQGVVNTIDTGSTPNNSGNNSNSAQTNNTAFPTTSSRPNSGLFSSSVRSRPPTPTGEHSGSRNSRGLSSIIRRPASMFNDNRGNTITEGDGTADLPSLGSDSTNGTSSDAPSDSTTPTAPSDSDPDSQTAQQRPLSPGSRIRT